MRKHSYLLFLLTFYSIGYSQTFIERGLLGNFSNATSFAITPAKLFYVSDSQINEIIKIDSLGNVLKTVGGFGWDNNSFDNPSDISTNVLTVYVADKNNNRIQLFDKDLNYVSSFATANSNDERFAFRYPTSVAVSTQGDFYILDSDNRRILKFNMRGEFITSIGGIDAGRYQLSNPLKICLDHNGNLIVLESNLISVFDQFGNGLVKINLQFEALNINAFFDSIVIANKNTIMILKASEQNRYEMFMQPTTLKLDEDIVDATIFNTNLYVLTTHSIHVMSK